MCCVVAWCSILRFDPRAVLKLLKAAFLFRLHIATKTQQSMMKIAIAIIRSVARESDPKTIGICPIDPNFHDRSNSLFWIPRSGRPNPPHLADASADLG